MSERNALYAATSNGRPRWPACQASISACSESRRASSSRLRGARSWTMASKPAQNSVDRDAGAGQRLVAYEIVEYGRDL